MNSGVRVRGDAACVGRKATCIRLSITAEDERSPSRRRDRVCAGDGCDGAADVFRKSCIHRNLFMKRLC